ncbi:MAG: prephenate dehydrogenase [Clostridia bacterium]|nr:prephenate dehydrogenase [Clostridia bacterium]
MKIGIIGLGLIGGSLARGFVKAGQEVLAWDLSEEVMQQGALLKAYDQVLTHDNASTVDMLVVALTPQATVQAWAEWAPYLKEGAILTDVAGTKRYVVEEALRLHRQYPHLEWVCTHPMAGREYSGIKHSQTTLFEKSTLLLVPIGTPIAVLAQVKETFSLLGFGRVIPTTAEEHDRIIAFTSQLAHVISNAYILSDTAPEQRGYSAGSFRDMTRVARINGKMWSELFVENKDNLAGEIDELIANLTAMRDAIAAGDRAKIEALLEEGNRRKEEADRQNRQKE